MARNKGRADEPTDRVTFLPIDRAGATWPAYPETHPRRAPPQGGMRLGREQPVWVRDGAVPPVDAEGVVAACDAVVGGKGVYRALVYLSRARPEDLPALVQATQAEEVRARWERLWVVAPTLSRLARQPEAADALVALLGEDLGAVHLLTKFGEQNNPTIKKLFARVHDPLLGRLLGALHEEGSDPRRTALLANVISAIEGDREVLRRLVPPELSPRAADNLVDMLYTRPPPRSHRRLRSEVLRDRLSRFRR